MTEEMMKTERKAQPQMRSAGCDTARKFVKVGFGHDLSSQGQAAMDG